MTNIEKLGELAAECDLEAAHMPTHRLMWMQLAAIIREEQIDAMKPPHHRTEDAHQLAYMTEWRKRKVGGEA